MAATGIGSPPIDAPILIDQAQETNLMAMITTRDGTRIFYKDWGPK